MLGEMMLGQVREEQGRARRKTREMEKDAGNPMMLK